MSFIHSTANLVRVGPAVSPSRTGSTTAESTGTLAASGITFTSADVGRAVVFENGKVKKITAVTDGSNVSVAPAFSVDSGVNFTLHEVSLTIGNDSSVNFGMPGSLNNVQKIEHQGTDPMDVLTMDAAPIRFGTNNTTRFSIDASGDVQFAGNLTVTGDVQIQGTTTTLDAQNLNIGDNIITLNSDATAAGLNAGIEVNRGSDGNVSFLWDETVDRWTAGVYGIQASELIENGTTLSAKYLGIGSKAVDSEMLDGHDSSYFAVAASTYTKAQVDSAIASATPDDIYTKAEVDAAVASANPYGSNLVRSIDGSDVVWSFA